MNCEVCGNELAKNGFNKGTKNQKYRPCPCDKGDSPTLPKIKEPKKILVINNDPYTNLPFTDEEINKIRSLINNQVINPINNNPDIIINPINNVDKQKRIIKSFNVEESLFVLLQEDSKKNKISMADILNGILQNYYFK